MLYCDVLNYYKRAKMSETIDMSKITNKELYTEFRKRFLCLQFYDKENLEISVNNQQEISEEKYQRFLEYCDDEAIYNDFDEMLHRVWNDFNDEDDEKEEEEKEEVKEFRLTDKYNYIKEQIYDLYDPDEEYNVEEFKLAFGEHEDALDWYDFEITGDEWLSANQFISNRIQSNITIDYTELKKQVLLKIMNECEF